MKPNILAAVVGVAGLAVGLGVGLVVGRRSAPTATIDAAGSRRTTPAAALVEKYLMQDKCMDRTALVFDPASNVAAMTHHYKETSSCLKRPKTIDDASCRGLAAGRVCNVRAAFDPNGWGDYCVRLAGSDMKIDWRCSMGWNPMPVKAFKAQMPKATNVFRVTAQISDYYNYDYGRLKATHYSFSFKDSFGETIYGYAERASAVGADAFERLKDGRERPLMVGLAYASSKSGDTAELVKVVADTWMQTAEE